MKKLLPFLFLTPVLFTTAQVTNLPFQLKDSVHVFAPNIISTGDHEFNASFTPNGNTVFFSKTSFGWDYIAIFQSMKVNGKWSVPVPVDFTGKYRDTDPFISPDGSKLFFMSDRPIAGKNFKDFDYHFFYVTLQGSKITSAPVHIPLPLPDSITTLYPSVAANGNLYFHIRSGRDADIYMSEWKDGKYNTPVALSFNDKASNDFDAVVSKDEKFIVFVSNNRTGGLGNNDIWIVFRNKETNQWGKPFNLGNKVNTNNVESATGLSADNTRLYFSSSRERINRNLDTQPSGPSLANDVLHSYKNGLPNIYEISIKEILDTIQN